MKVFLRQTRTLVSALVLILLTVACEKKYFPEEPAPPPPKTPTQTSTLEASFVDKAPITVTDAYWKTADYLKVNVNGMNTGSLYPDGYLNMTDTYGGTAAFNDGGDPKLIMKAAYDNDKVYIYVEWVDNSLSAYYKAALLKGASDPLKSDTTGGWTSQGNSDKMALAFEVNNASSAAGTFVDKGCAASCHNSKMQPQNGTVDIWSWDVASSEALGYASDMVADAVKGFVKDTGASMIKSNKVISGNPRSAPAFEWNGTDQVFTRPDGKSVTLDPGYYLLSTNTTTFLGNPKRGEEVYKDAAANTDCEHCHGVNGKGGEATEFASIGFARKYSRQGMATISGSSDHPGQSRWLSVQPADRDHLFAFIRGLGSVPGQILSAPDGSHADVWSVSNINRTKINQTPHTTYSVILVRKLNTGNSDDAQFSSPAGKTYPFGIALMDADGKNHIGSNKEILTFKQK